MSYDYDFFDIDESTFFSNFIPYVEQKLLAFFKPRVRGLDNWFCRFGNTKYQIGMIMLTSLPAILVNLKYDNRLLEKYINSPSSKIPVGALFRSSHCQNVYVCTHVHIQTHTHRNKQRNKQSLTHTKPHKTIYTHAHTPNTHKHGSTHRLTHIYK